MPRPPSRTSWMKRSALTRRCSRAISARCRRRVAKLARIIGTVCNGRYEASTGWGTPRELLLIDRATMRAIAKRGVPRPCRKALICFAYQSSVLLCYCRLRIDQ